MVYLHLSDRVIEAIETHKSLIGREKIVSVVRREIPEGLIVEGSIEKSEELKNLVKEVLATGYPKPIRSNHVSLIIPDSQIVTKRLNILPEELKRELENSLGEDLNLYEHFYKVIRKEDKKEILYTGMKHDQIEKWQDILSSLSLDLTFLTGESFAFLAFLGPLLTPSDVLLYCHVHDRSVTYFVYDTEGPKRIWTKKITGKTFALEAKAQIEKYEKEEHPITKVLLGGEGSIEILTSEVKEIVERETAKVSDVFETIIGSHKIDFVTQGEAKMFFLPVIGLLLLTKKEKIPNFVKDKTIRKAPVQEVLPVQQQEVPSQNQGSLRSHEEPVVRPVQSISVSENINSFIPDSIVEYKKTTFFDFFRGKFFLIVLLLSAAAVLLSGVFFMRGNKMGNLPFFSAPPTLTPTPTVIPSPTPTPTIDPKLKRSDLKVSVENGTTKTGYAKDMATFLETKGYKNVGKGNADTDTYQETVLKIKEKKKNYTTLLTVDLTEKVQIASTEPLSDDNDYDAVIRLGSN